MAAERHAHDAGGNIGYDPWVSDRLILVFSKKPAHPANAFPLDDVVGIDPLFQIGSIGDMSADDDDRLGLMLSDQPTHPPYLEKIGNDGADPNHIVLSGLDLLDEPTLRGKVQERARSLQVHLDEHESPGSVEGAQREGVLHSRHLVVIQLHRVEQPAAVLIVLSIGAEYAQQ